MIAYVLRHPVYSYYSHPFCSPDGEGFRPELRWAELFSSAENARDGREPLRHPFRTGGGDGASPNEVAARRQLVRESTVVAVEVPDEWNFGPRFLDLGRETNYPPGGEARPNGGE